jgi:nitrate reductase gamma subunit
MVMILGLGRLLFIALAGMFQAYRRAGNKALDGARIARKTAAGAIPSFRLNGIRWVFSTGSLFFHLGLIVVPLFLHGHIRLWEKGIGLSWPALPMAWADGLSILVIVTGAGLLLGRISYPPSRSISRWQDFLLPLFILLVFVSGVLASHPHWNPFHFPSTLLVHVLSGNFLFLLLPFSKLAHAILWPFRHLATELAWRFPPDAGSKVLSTLGKEDKV